MQERSVAGCRAAGQQRFGLRERSGIQSSLMRTYTFTHITLRHDNTWAACCFDSYYWARKARAAGAIVCVWTNTLKWMLLVLCTGRKTGADFPAVSKLLCLLPSYHLGELLTMSALIVATAQIKRSPSAVSRCILVFLFVIPAVCCQRNRQFSRGTREPRLTLLKSEVAICPGTQRASECQAEQGRDDSWEANPLK